MVQEEIVLGHRVFKEGIEVDKEKIKVIDKLPSTTSVKGIKSFLGHSGFYKRFIKDFSKIVKPLCMLQEHDRPFKFDENYLKAFVELKRSFITALILVTPYWSMSFKLLCDISDHSVGAMPG